MAATLVGIFDEMAEAERARRKLISAGISDRLIQLTSAEGGKPGKRLARGDHLGFLARLFGLDEPDEQVGNYAEAVRRGAAMLTVSLEQEAQEDTVIRILEASGAVDIDERVERWKAEGFIGSEQGAPLYSRGDARLEQQTLRVVREELLVEKRPAAGKGVRVHRRIVRQPASEQINLGEERFAQVELEQVGDNIPERHAGPERRMRSLPYPGPDRRIDSRMGA